LADVGDGHVTAHKTLGPTQLSLCFKIFTFRVQNFAIINNINMNWQLASVERVQSVYSQIPFPHVKPPAFR
jgi:hypothetical protein